MAQLEDAFHYGYWRNLVEPIDIVLLHWAAVLVSDEEGQAIRNGRPLFLGDSSLKQQFAAQSPLENRCRAYTHDGCFLGVLRFDPEGGQWQPEKVFPQS